MTTKNLNDHGLVQYLTYCIFVILLFASCKEIPKEPVEGAKQYCEDLNSFAVKNDYYHADELTRKYFDKYEEKDCWVFIMELTRLLRTPEKQSLGVFISNADGDKYPNMMELMRRVLAVSNAEKYNAQYTASGAEKAALFCSLLRDLAKKQDYNTAKSLMKQFVQEYVDEFYQDGAVYLNNNLYKECEDFCISFKKNMTQDIFNFINSKGMKSEEYTHFQIMCLAGIQAAEDDKN